jgi:hypothetical protein
MPRFQTVIKSARFVYSPYTATEMQGFGHVLADSIRARIQSGQNIYDQAAAPLKPGSSGRRGYPDYKAARGLRPVRDWTWSGHTLRCLKVLTANENRAAIGVLESVGKANTALDSFEKKSESSHGQVIPISDQTRTSVQRLVASLEKQAEIYGKSGVDKLIIQRDQLLQRYGREPQARSS